MRVMTLEAMLVKRSLTFTLLWEKYTTPHKTVPIIGTSRFKGKCKKNECPNFKVVV